MRRSAEEWIVRGAHDLAAAQLLLDREALLGIVLFHVHQAIEKHLKGFLIEHDWKLKKIHDLETLITEAIDFDASLRGYLDLGRKLTAFYYVVSYPPGPMPSPSAEETRELLEAAKELIEKITETS